MVSKFETVEEAYDHLNEFYELKCFEVIGDYGQEDNEEDDEESDESEEWEEVKGNAHGKRSGKKKPPKPQPEFNFNENNIFAVKEQNEEKVEA